MTDQPHEQLKSLVERRERLEAVKAEALEDIKELNAEIKAFGFDMKVFNQVIARRKLDRDAVAQADALLDMYEGAL